MTAVALGAVAAAGTSRRARAETADLQQVVDQALATAKNTTGGKNADYIPYLANVDPDLTAVSIVTKDGGVHTAGDASFGFALESISKVMTLALVMEEIGPDGVREKVGADPTGLPFNSVIALDLHKDKPLSPLVNAGAIATASLVPGKTADEKWARVLDFQSRLAGSEISLSDEVNESEQTTNFHNRGIAWLLYSAGTVYSDPMLALDVYTRQCSTLVTCEQLATMGATLANNGINPKTGERVVTAENVPHILAEMMMEGLYTYSGDFAYTVGLPGKSGVGGGIFAVAPGDLSIAGFSPPLDAAGNSVGALAAVSDAAKSLGLNVFKA
ncbi:MAG: glutaminase A [Pseudomonadota bacterium]